LYNAYMPIAKKASPNTVSVSKARKAVVVRAKKNKILPVKNSIKKISTRQKIHTVTIADKTGSNSRSSKSTIAAKLLKVESLHAKRPENSIKAARKTPKTSKTPVGSRRESKQKVRHIVPTLLSPYRFPIDVQKMAVATARFAGIFFIVFGAAFTLWFSDLSFGSVGLRANVFSAQILDARTALFTSSSNVVTQTIDCTLKENYSHTSCKTVGDAKPTADIVVNNPSALTGSVQVKIKVPYAESVTLMAYDRTQNRDVTIGKASKVSSDAWEMYWRTNEYDDGQYKLKVLIKNQYGSYEQVDNEYVIVSNANLEEFKTMILKETVENASETLVTEGEDVLDVTKEVSTDTLSKPVLSIAPASSVAEFSLEVSAKDAEKVKIYAKKKLGTSQELLGYAYKVDGALWKYRLSSTNIAPGEYVLTAYALINGRNYPSEGVALLVPEKVEALTKDEILPSVAQAITNTDGLTPAAKVVVSGVVPISGIRTIRVEVPSASSIELYAKSKDSLTLKYIGRAISVDTGVWTFSWDTRLTPNGEYTLSAFIKNTFGIYAQESSSFIVNNIVQTTYTESQQKTIDAVSTLDSVTTRFQNEPPVGAIVINETEVPRTDILIPFSEAIDADLQRLAAALRSKDPHAIERANKRLEELKLQVRTSLKGELDDEALRGLLDAQIDEAIVRTKEDVKRIEKVILERTGENMIKDSDSDGISDYDEIHIYGTDPFSADTDGDGFTDGAEILSGFDPLDPRAESVVVFESPKERGIVRDDILKVEAVISAQKNEGGDVTTPPAALISGKALPHSFVTLYIFSTPVIVTVKTDEVGNWVYRFDKELEDGQHEVYVGITDNAGRLVAKSSPFTFIKVAEAYTAAGTTHTAQPTSISDNGIASRSMIYLVLSISVVAIGLVLVLLGLYLERRQRIVGGSEALVSV